MGSLYTYQPHKLLIPVLFSTDWSIKTVQGLVADAFGPVDLQSEAFPFDFTHYYDYEMGDSIYRILFSIEELVDPMTLSDVKSRSNDIEVANAGADGNRTINIDPGLLSLSRVILATTKQSAHRISIGAGLYAEITLMYRKGRYRPLEWTYPDFQSERYGQWLKLVRTQYHQQLRDLDPERAWRL